MESVYGSSLRDENRVKRRSVIGFMTVGVVGAAGIGILVGPKRSEIDSDELIIAAEPLQTEPLQKEKEGAWTLVVAENGMFELMMPAKPEQTRAADRQIKFQLVTPDLGNFWVSIDRVRGEENGRRPLEDIYDNWQKGMLQNLGQQYQLLSSEQQGVVTGGHSGRELRLLRKSLDGGAVRERRTRVYFVDRRYLYALSHERPLEVPGAVSERFLGSLKVPAESTGARSR